MKMKTHRHAGNIEMAIAESSMKINNVSLASIISMKMATGISTSMARKAKS